MNEGKKDIMGNLSGLSFIDQVVDGIRSVGESLKVQGLIDDALYMATKGLTNILLNLGTKFTVDGRVQGAGDLIANRGIIFTTLASNPLDIIILTQVATKKMEFVISRENAEKPVLKSLLKTFGIIADLDEFIQGVKDEEIYNVLKVDRKVLAVIVDESEDPRKMEQAYEKLMLISRDGFAPIVPVGIKGSENLQPGGEVVLKLGDRTGVNQDKTADDMAAMAKDLIVKLRAIKE
ncbi:MAG: hypothetical protein ACTSUE_23190 [Promethearchaeota archaeon]